MVVHNIYLDPWLNKTSTCSHDCTRLLAAMVVHNVYLQPRLYTTSTCSHGCIQHLLAAMAVHNIYLQPWLYTTSTCSHGYAQHLLAAMVYTTSTCSHGCTQHMLAVIVVHNIYLQPWVYTSTCSHGYTEHLLVVMAIQNIFLQLWLYVTTTCYHVSTSAYRLGSGDMRHNLDSFYKPENICMPSSCSFQPPVTFPLEKHVPAMSHSKHLPQGEVRLRYDVHKVICSSLHVNIFYVQFLKLLHKNNLFITFTIIRIHVQLRELPLMR